jgi:hypothetical protein
MPCVSTRPSTEPSGSWRAPLRSGVCAVSRREQRSRSGRSIVSAIDIFWPGARRGQLPQVLEDRHEQSADVATSARIRRPLRSCRDRAAPRGHQRRAGGPANAEPCSAGPPGRPLYRLRRRAGDTRAHRQHPGLRPRAVRRRPRLQPRPDHAGDRGRRALHRQQPDAAGLRRSKDLPRRRGPQLGSRLRGQRGRRGPTGVSHLSLRHPRRQRREGDSGQDRRGQGAARSGLRLPARHPLQHAGVPCRMAQRCGPQRGGQGDRHSFPDQCLRGARLRALRCQPLPAAHRHAERRAGLRCRLSRQHRRRDARQYHRRRGDRVHLVPDLSRKQRGRGAGSYRAQGHGGFQPGSSTAARQGDYP